MENINTEVALFLPPTWGQVLGYTPFKWPHLTFVNDDKKEEKTRAFQLRCLHLSSDRVISAVLLTNRNGMNVTAETLFHKDFESRVPPQPMDGREGVGEGVGEVGDHAAYSETIMVVSRTEMRYKVVFR